MSARAGRRRQSRRVHPRPSCRRAETGLHRAVGSLPDADDRRLPPNRCVQTAAAPPGWPRMSSSITSSGPAGKAHAAPGGGFIPALTTGCLAPTAASWPGDTTVVDAAPEGGYPSNSRRRDGRRRTRSSARRPEVEPASNVTHDIPGPWRSRTTTTSATSRASVRVQSVRRLC